MEIAHHLGQVRLRLQYGDVLFEKCKISVPSPLWDPILLGNRTHSLVLSIIVLIIFMFRREAGQITASLITSRAF